MKKKMSRNSLRNLSKGRFASLHEQIWDMIHNSEITVTEQTLLSSMFFYTRILMKQYDNQTKQLRKTFTQLEKSS